MFVQKNVLLELADAVLHDMIQNDLIWASRYPTGYLVYTSWLIDTNAEQAKAINVLQNCLNKKGATHGTC